MVRLPAVYGALMIVQQIQIVQNTTHQTVKSLRAVKVMTVLS